MPSRDEPFGLVAVEFGRKGALCIGSRVGGLGSMPGWWFTIESTTTKHLISQFKLAIQGALASKLKVREKMRARSAMQRYPVAQWKETLGILQDNAIRLNQKQTLKQGLRTPRRIVSDGDTTTPPSGNNGPLRFWYRSGLSSVISTAPQSRSQSRTASRTASRTQSPSRGSEIGPPTLGRKLGPGHSPDERGRKRNRLSKPNPHRESSAASQIGMAISSPLEASSAAAAVPAANRVSRITEAENEDSPRQSFDEYILTPEQAEANKKSSQMASLQQAGDPAPEGRLYRPSFAPDTSLSQTILSDAPVASSDVDEPLMPESAHVAGPTDGGNLISASVARLSLAQVVKDKKDYKLQNVDPFFDDPTGLYYNAFERKLDGLNGKTSEDSLCVEEYLVKSERDWFNRFRGAKMGRTSLPPSPMFRTRENSPAPSVSNGRTRSNSISSSEGVEQFLLQEDYKPPTGLKKILLKKVGDWPVYTFLLAFVSDPLPVLGRKLTDSITGTNYRRKLISDHTPDRCSRSSGRKTVYHRLNLSHYLSHLVVHFPQLSVEMGACRSLRLLRPGVFLSRSGTLRLYSVW